jgi:hypothetical protein
MEPVRLELEELLPGAKLILRDIEVCEGVLLLRPPVLVRRCGGVESIARAFQMKQDAESLRHTMFRRALEDGEDPPPVFTPLDLRVLLAMFPPFLSTTCPHLVLFEEYCFRKWQRRPQCQQHEAPLPVHPRSVHPNQAPQPLEPPPPLPSSGRGLIAAAPLWPLPLPRRPSLAQPWVLRPQHPLFRQ